MCVPAQTRRGKIGGWRWIRNLSLAAILLSGALFGAGCNPLSWRSFIFMSDPDFPPDAFKSNEKKPNPKVVFLVCHASARTQADTELFNADQLLAQRLTQLLAKLHKDRGDKIQIVPPTKVDAFKSRHL